MWTRRSADGTKLEQSARSSFEGASCPIPRIPRTPRSSRSPTAPASVVPAAPAPSQRPAPDLAAELWPPAVGTGTERTGLRDRRLPAAALRSEAAETEETAAQTLVVLAARRHRRHRHCQRARRRGRGHRHLGERLVRRPAVGGVRGEEASGEGGCGQGCGGSILWNRRHCGCR